MKVPSKPKPPKPQKPAHDRNAANSVGRVHKPQNDTTRGRVLTGPEARKEQEKKKKTTPKGSYSGATRI